ncbi:MAG TPA: lysophospholipid acyltransferase family protein [Bacteroidia bacterium]|jgi:1-acyl-sn-glycerol-3-phosphate acyltransferase|nr:lysophospholipid acyltransferase family protein [Bacteroidia bacterium]HRG53623.1 lysophospholipid acyltransferase family protein [Bacteroidia bacterium]
MKYLLIIPRALWKLLFLLNFVLGLLILYPFFYLFLSRKKWFPLAFKLKKVWACWILLIPGLFVRIKRKTPKDNLPQPCIYCSNHVSYLDIVVSYIFIPNYFVFMGKQELNKAPLFNIFFREMNILVDRKSAMSSHRAFLRAANELKNGNSVFLYPEGTISSSGKLRGFKNGAFKLAIEQQVPIVPITYLNNWKLLQNGGFFKASGRPGVSRIIVHEPISTTGMTEDDLVSLRSKVHQLIADELEKKH